MATKIEWLNKKSFFTIVWIFGTFGFVILWRVVRIDMRERGAAIMLLVHTYILLPHAVTKYGAHADITRRKMRGYDAFALQKQTHPTPTGSPPPPKCAARVGNIYARLTFDMLIRALIGPLIDRVTRYCQFWYSIWIPWTNLEYV